MKIFSHFVLVNKITAAQHLHVLFHIISNSFIVKNRYITWSRYLGKSSVSTLAVELATSDGLITAQFPFVK